MAFLNENEWIRLNEIAYNISFIYTVEEMQHEILNRRNYFGLYGCNKNLVLFTFPEFLNRSFIRKIICLPSDYTQKYKE